MTAQTGAVVSRYTRVFGPSPLDMTVVGIVVPGASVTPLVERVLASSDLPLKSGEDGLPVIRVGSGLVQVGEEVVAVRAGRLHYGRPNKFWIEHVQRRVGSPEMQTLLTHPIRGSR